MESLVKIFNNAFFRIPYYQRGYSWAEKQRAELWQDISNLLNHETRCHYMGMLGKEKIHPKENFLNIDGYSERIHERFEFYFIVDGQQRFLTLLIILCVLTESIEDDEDIGDTKSEIINKYIKNKNLFIVDYLKDDPSHLFLNNYVFENKNKKKDKKQEDSSNYDTIYINNLQQAKAFFEEKIETIEKKSKDRKSFLEKLRQLYMIITNRLLFDNNTFEGNLEISMIFETMNSRGKTLSYLELLKNRLMYLSSSIALKGNKDDKEDLKKINNSWSIIYEFLGYISKIDTDSEVDNEFLLNHWIMYGNYDRKVSEFYKENIFNSIFKISRIENNNKSEPNLLNIEKDDDEAEKEDYDDEILTITYYYKLKQSSELTIDQIHDYRESLTESILYWSLIKNPYYDFSKLLKRKYSDNFGKNVKLLLSKIDTSPEIIIWLKKLKYIGLKAFPPILLCAFLRKEDSNKIIRLLKEIEKHIFLVFFTSIRRADTGKYRFYSWANRYFVNHEEYKKKFTKFEFMKTIEEIIKEVNYWTFGDDNNGYVDLENFYKYMNDQFSMEFSPRDGFKSWGQSRSIKYFLLEYEFWINKESKLNYTDVEVVVIKEYLSDKEKEKLTSNNSLKPEERKALLRNKKRQFTLGNLSLRAKDPELQKNLLSCREIDPNNWDDKKSKERGIRLLKFLEERWNVKFDDWDISYTKMLFLD